MDLSKELADIPYGQPIKTKTFFLKINSFKNLVNLYELRKCFCGLETPVDSKLWATVK